MLYMVKVWKVLTTELQPLEYSNQYVYQTELPMTDATLFDMALNTARAEQVLHLSAVSFRRATVGIYAPEKPNQSTEYQVSVNLAELGFFGQRPAIEPAPNEFALQVQKQTPAYRNGRLWYFGCLNMSQVTIGSGDRWKLKETEFLQFVLDYWYHGLYLAAIPGILVVPQWSQGVPASQAIQPANLRVGGLVVANARKRSRAKRSGLGPATFAVTAQALDTTTTAIREVGNWLGLGTDFNPSNLRSMVETAIGEVGAAAGAAEGITSHAENDLDPPPKTPIPRWGKDAQELWALACDTKQAIRGWTQTTASIEPYEFIDGGTYFKLEDLQNFMSILKQCRAKAVELNDYDYFNNALMVPPMTPCS
jgi:hypothetical protein